MTELGRVYDGLMVYVMATNAKLVARGRRIVRAIAGCSEAEAEAAYEEAGRSIPLAILLLRGLSLETGNKRLSDARGDLRQALAALS